MFSRRVLQSSDPNKSKSINDVGSDASGGGLLARMKKAQEESEGDETGVAQQSDVSVAMPGLAGFGLVLVGLVGLRAGWLRSSLACFFLCRYCLC